MEVCLVDDQNSISWKSALNDNDLLSWIQSNQWNTNETVKFHNITGPLVDNLQSLLFGTRINLKTYRVFLCEPNLLTSILFVLIYLICICSKWRLYSIFSVRHFKWTLKHLEQQTNGVQFRRTKILFTKKLILFVWISVQLFQIVLFLWTNINSISIDRRGYFILSSGVNLYSPIVFYVINLFAMLCLSHYYLRKVSPSRTFADILVSLYWLLSVINLMFVLISYLIFVSIDARRSMSIKHICTACVWNTPTTPLSHQWNNRSYLSTFEIYFNLVYFGICFIQFVLSFGGDFMLVLSKHTTSNNHPELNSTFFGQLLFVWFNQTINSGFRRPLLVDDIYKIHPTIRVQPIVDHFKSLYHSNRCISTNRLSSCWLKSIQSSSYHLLLTLIRQFGIKFLYVSLLKLAPSLLTFVVSLLLDRLIQFMQYNNKQPQWHGLFYIILMFLLSMCESILNSQYRYHIMVLSLQVRATLTAAIYQNVLDNAPSDRRYTSGQIVNIMSIDTHKVYDYIRFANLFVICPIQIIIGMYLLWNHLEYGSLAGLVVLLLLLPFNTFIGARMHRLQSHLLTYKDQRLKLLNETVSGVRAVKLYAWEEAFFKRIESLRGEEVKRLRLIALYSAAITFTFNSATFFVALASFGFYILLNPTAQLTAQKAFVSLAIFDIIRRPFASFPNLITNSLMFMVSLRRIGEFLSSFTPLNSTQSLSTSSLSPKIQIHNVTFNYVPTSTFQLKISKLVITEPKLVAIIGEMGSGKSTLFNAILGQMKASGGEFLVNGRIGYVPQNAWIQSGTARENILFGCQFDEKWYWKVVDACALRKDFKSMTDGDNTLIGEKGFSISGGQKQRISLARAVYMNADIYLFDDPLSALDTQVGRHIFFNVIHNNGLLKSKIRLFVTNNMTILSQMDQIFRIENGSLILNQFRRPLSQTLTPFTDYMKCQQNCTELSDEELDDLNILETNVLEPEDCGTMETVVLERQLSFLSRNKSPFRKITDRCKRNVSEKITVEANANQHLLETLKTGSISWKIYIKYIGLFGWTYVLFTMLFYSIWNVFVVLTNIWLSSWSNDSNQTLVQETDSGTLSFNNSSNVSQQYRLTVYALFGLCQTIFILIGTILLSLACIQSAQKLHTQMLYQLLRAPFSFFTSTNTSQILNRFSKDVDTTDTTLLTTLRLMIIEIFRTISAIYIISVGTQSPEIVLIFLLLILIYFIIYRYYISTSRQLTRLSSALRTPLYSSFTETYNGVHVIQAFQKKNFFLEKTYGHIDQFNSANHMSIVANNWISIRIELLGNIVVLITALFCVLMRGVISPGMAGLCVTCALKITSTLNLLIQSFTYLVNDIVSVERLMEYTQISSEAEWHSSEKIDFPSIPKSMFCIGKQKLWALFNRKRQRSIRNYFKCPARDSPSWIKSGSISICMLFARYKNSESFCLKNLNVTIESGSKVAIVGRTGAGKSSIAFALFRLIEPVSGCINIGGRNIQELGLHEHRSALSIIPQESFLFSGTLRTNLDPLEQFTDEQLISALDNAHLGVLVRTMGLDCLIDECVQKISPGQRQLFSLARAILQQPKILILDEATSSIDPATDQLVQETIEKLFFNCTVLTIAHRLNTILHYDQIMVLDNGEIIEFDSPQTLAKDPASHFHQMLLNRL